MSKYEGLDRDTLIRLLEQRDHGRQLGLEWERDEIDADQAINDDFVGLQLDTALSHGEAPWDNLIIEGDNYDALRALRMTHAGRIRCIYIDPPYNTGNKDFVYNDRFVDKTHRFRHSLWLEFMYHRLLLAKELLAEDGVIFVSIDDNELFRLGMLMDRVFGEGNFLANVIWQKVYSPKNSAQHFSDDHEYILIYAKESTKWQPNPLPRNATQNKAYKNPDNDPRGPWKAGDLSARNHYSLGTYSITCPSGRVIPAPPSGMYWRVSEKKLKEMDADGRIWWGKDGNNVPAVKRFLSETKQGVVPQTLWTYQEVGHTQDAKKQLLEVLKFDTSQEVFSTPKPVKLMERILRIACNPGDIVLDFFAGSGTTAQAVAKLNAEDNGERRFILVSNSEATADAPEKNLCRDVCAERVRRIMGGYTNSKGEDVEGLGGSFAYLRSRQVPMHRLPTKIAHDEVWHALQLLHEAPLQPWIGSGFQAIETHDGWVAYLADQKAASIGLLENWLEKAKPIRGRVYSWSPERFETQAPLLDWPRIPDALQARFSKRKR
ncbi:site-specific DNA-methyltransferase [Chromohalobacter japonicus]|uniref:site-specific DNA-methyltransferase (adenine-specific) n=1 Tax=Chromohalobacter japonicus TaxID=223900 RepID=A0A1Q8TA61_9GAMM|nr:site-specific DNA-methyltransferase [Chromohalobacter japonicus]OLO10508.1 site-specific DNA-methyltransferase [Chromohalobacter japonicus]